jgi:hypothetical protein
MRRRQCCGNRSKDPKIPWQPVSGMKNFMLRQWSKAMLQYHMSSTRGAYEQTTDLCK